MTLPLNSEVVINLFREIALSSTLQLSNDKDRDDLELNSIYGKLFINDNDNNNNSSINNNLSLYELKAFKNLYRISTTLSCSPPIPTTLNDNSNITNTNNGTDSDINDISNKMNIGLAGHKNYHRKLHGNKKLTNKKGKDKSRDRERDKDKGSSSGSGRGKGKPNKASLSDRNNRKFSVSTLASTINSNITSSSQQSSSYNKNRKDSDDNKIHITVTNDEHSQNQNASNFNNNNDYLKNNGNNETYKEEYMDDHIDHYDYDEDDGIKIKRLTINSSPNTIRTLNSERTIDSSIMLKNEYDSDYNKNDISDGDSVVDSIESSELADSDYDYFNPPLTAMSQSELRNKTDTSLIHNTVSSVSSVDIIDSDFSDDDQVDDEDDEDDEDDDDDDEDDDDDDDDDDYDDFISDGDTIDDLAVRNLMSESDKYAPSSISKISFMKTRPNGSRRASFASNTSRKRRSVTSSLSENMHNINNNNNDKFKSVKSFTNLILLNKEMNEDKKIDFEKLIIKKDLKPVIKLSNLSSLINKNDSLLDYYKYVGNKHSVEDLLIDINVKIPYLNKDIDEVINTSVQVVELIGYILYILQKNGNLKEKIDPKFWKLYLADEDGEIEDDFGVLDRRRSIISYGKEADEFVLVECNEKEILNNEKITPSPLKIQEAIINDNSNNLKNMNKNKNVSFIEGINNIDNIDNIDNTDNNLTEGLTPVSGLMFDTLPSHSNININSKNRVPIIQSFVLDGNSNDEDEDSDNEEVDNKFSKQKVKKDIKKYGYLKNQLKNNNFGTNNVNNHKDNFVNSNNNFNSNSNFNFNNLNNFSIDNNNNNNSTALDKFKNKTKSRTIQSILHNTADHYQQTQQELFRDNTGVGYKGIGGVGFDYNDVNEIFKEGDKLMGYHRWNIWRRQQMKFRSKLAKTLVIDGYQIYILPFNESKGSWYESKTYNFDISQVLKVKVNPKVENFFKIVVKKGDGEMVKKYYLEAHSSKECKEIVNTIKALASSYTAV